jgi:hypothetical protein
MISSLVRRRERDVILQSLAAHPTLLLEGSTENSKIQVLEALVDYHKLGEEEQRLVRTLNHPDITYADGRYTDTKTARDLALEIKTISSSNPARWNRRYLIIGYVDRLHYIATQTLLKLIEEPPSQFRSILLAGDIHRLPPTIISRARFYPIKPPTQAEIEGMLKEQGIDEPAWRAQACGGYADIAAELDTNFTREWHKLWQNVLAGGRLMPDLAYSWTERLSEQSEATHTAVWELLVQIAAKAAHSKYWREVAMRAIEERERSLQGKAKLSQGKVQGRESQIATSTALAYIYAQIRTAIMRPQH